jgi:HD-GYP domain-containing protein (c-di-GMP phosphodiesterase class II)
MTNGMLDAEMEELRDIFADQEILIEIGRNLFEERNTGKLMGMILDACKRITCADAGSVFLCEEGENGPALRFKHSHTTSRPLEYEEFVMPRNERSIAGYVATTGKVLNLPDVYRLDPTRPYGFNRHYDLESGYRTRSMLVVPMRDHEGVVIGVIQLINSKEGGEADGRTAYDVMLRDEADFELKVFPFKARYNSLMVAVANQAALALENSRMIKRIEEQFDAFVRASVLAIESRDPATSGHSFRVARAAVSLMAAVDAERDGVYSSCSFSAKDRLELEYAGLLHDFGKVYIDSRIFTKAKKLFERDYDCLVLRLKFLYRTIELEYARRGFAALGEGGTGRLEAVQEECARALEGLMRTMSAVSALNEPRETETDPRETIAGFPVPPPELRADLDGTTLPLLTEAERENLAIRRGSLNAEERKVIQSHVDYTVTFVSNIPWPPELSGIPEYCAKHHEMLNGSGYPAGLRADCIPLQARMLAVADIYDALAARDRPYKKALPEDAVERILREEAETGKLDAELVRIFLEKECWKASGDGLGAVTVPPASR